MRKEWLARTFVIVLVVAAVAIPLGVRAYQSRSILIHGRIAENGGWTPENLTAQVGTPLHLRLTSEDVLHGFAVGQSDQPTVDVIPGKVTETTLTFDRPGRYTFYCTHWCSINHWRMRGVIEVSGPGPESEPAQPPLYVSLGLDIDAEHYAEVVPEHMPAAWRGAQLEVSIPNEYKGRDYYLTHSPEQLWESLRVEAGLSGLSDQDIWDLVAGTWKANRTPAEVQTGQQLYAANCAACHGETGAGDGVFAAGLGHNPTGEHTEMEAEQMTKPPAAFNEPAHLLAASPAHLQGKILRGGMGTGMPYWGSIFTEEQTWALVAYLWTFQFDLEDQP